MLRNVAGGWRLYTHPDTATAVERFVLSSRQARLTKAALETLAIVAYKQPVTRHQVSGIRGVNSDGVLRALADRGLIEEAGRDETPGVPCSTPRPPGSWSASVCLAGRLAVAGAPARPEAEEDGALADSIADDEPDGAIPTSRTKPVAGRTEAAGRARARS